jgi:hypothetical protein
MECLGMQAGPTERKLWDKSDSDQSETSANQGTPRIEHQGLWELPHQELGRKDSPLEPVMRAGPCNTLIFDF